MTSEREAPGGTGTAVERPAEDGRVSDDTVAELQFGLFKQIGTLALASAGGAITLLQTVLRDAVRRPAALVAVGGLLASAVLALVAQQYLVERLGEASRTEQPGYLFPPLVPRSKKTERVLLGLATALMGAGLGMFASVALNVL